MKQTKGVLISQQTLRKAAKKAKLFYSSSPLTTVAILANLRDAHQVLRDFQKQHIELREDFLESLAEARALHFRPTLGTDPDKLEKATEKEVRRIQRNERSRRSHKSVRRCLRPQEVKNGLAKIDVPMNPSADPKSWDGPWKTITEPEEIAMKVCQANAEQYHQAWKTPFAEEPLLSYIGRAGSGPGSEAILQCIMPPENILKHLLPETRSILQTLAQIPTQSTLAVEETQITQEKFQALYKKSP
jgi:hypothetical protein